MKARLRAWLCNLTHSIGITICAWSIRLQGDGPGPWPNDEDESLLIDARNSLLVSFRD